MRLVAWGLQTTAKAADTGGPYGWFHVAKDGTLENFGQSCQASIHRFDMEWPDDCTRLGHTLGIDATPDDKASYELDRPNRFV